MWKKVIKNPFLVKFFFKIIYYSTITFPFFFLFYYTFYYPLCNFCFCKIHFSTTFCSILFFQFVKNLSLKVFLFFCTAFSSVNKLLISYIPLFHFKRFSLATLVKFAFLANFVTDCPHMNFPHGWYFFYYVIFFFFFFFEGGYFISVKIGKIHG